MPLAFLNLGPGEMLLVLVLFLLLFGVQKAPEVARSLGRAKAELDRVQRGAAEALRTDDERALEKQLAFERMREEHVRQQLEDPEHAALVKAASELGLATQGKGKDELRAAIRGKLDEAPAGPEKV